MPLVVIIGPSGSGKSTVVRELHRRHVVLAMPTWTTRPRRADELGGSLEHRFVPESLFDLLDHRGFFVETATMPGLPFRYGLPRLEPECGLATAVISRAAQVPRTAARVHQLTVPYDVARARLVARGCTAAELDARLSLHEREEQDGLAIADRVFCNDGAVDDIVAAIAAEIRAGAA